MEAVFEIPRLQNFFEWLDHSGAFLRVASVRLPDGRSTHQNFALQRHAVLAVLPLDAKEAEHGWMPAARQVVHDVSCLATFGVLHGRLHAYAGMRLADYLLHHAGFIVLHDCRVEHVGQSRGEKPMEAVFINAEHVVGVTDEGSTVAGQLRESAAPARRGMAPTRKTPPSRKRR
jgi:hypothetical protein